MSAVSLGIALLVVVSSTLGSQASPSNSRPPASMPTNHSMSCDTIPAYHALDFWVGEWVVTADGQEVGRNRIEKVIHGCAVIENWVDASGVEGKSLFYYQRLRQDWKQVWVDPSGVKEKHVVARYADGSIRFQGELPRANGVFVQDRTTLSPLADGTVRQVIEQSLDGGKTWVIGFDAIYRRAGKR